MSKGKKGESGKVRSIKSTVSIDLSQVMTNLNGKPLPVDVDGKPGEMTLATIMISVLCARDDACKPQERVRRGHLAMMIHEAEESIDLVRDDAETIKKLVEEKTALPLVAAKASDMIKEALEV